MCNKLSTIVQFSWLPYLGWLLWIGAYSQLLGATAKMRDIVLFDPQLMYWIATIGAYFIVAMICIQIVYRIISWLKKDSHSESSTEKAIQAIQEELDKLKKNL